MERITTCRLRFNGDSRNANDKVMATLLTASCVRLVAGSLTSKSVVCTAHISSLVMAA